VVGWWGEVGSYPLLSQAPTPVEVELGCDKRGFWWILLCQKFGTMWLSMVIRFVSPYNTFLHLTTLE
jgi:hypothetical protein